MEIRNLGKTDVYLYRYREPSGVASMALHGDYVSWS